jgi:signal transduction histidine kinase
VEAVYVVALLALVALLPLRKDVTWVDWCLYATIFVLLGVMRLLRPRFPATAGFVGGFGFIVLVTAAAWFRQGLASGVSSAAYALAVVVGGLLWGPRKTIVLAAIASAGAAVLAWHAPTRALAPLRSWAELTAILITMALFEELLLAALGKRINEARSSRKQFQQLFDGSPDALVVVDKRASVQLANRAARQLIGSDVPVGTALAALSIFQGSNAALLPMVMGVDVDTGIQRLPVGLDSIDAELSLATNRYHELTVSALSGVAGEINETVLLTIRDVTERVGAARARRDFESQLAKSKSLEALGRLAGGVAHDFNNLLTVIIGTTDLLIQEPAMGSQALTDLAGIKASASKAAELTSQLLSFGRKQILESVVFNVNDGLCQLQPLLDRLVPSSVALAIHLDPALGDVRTDPARLDQVLINLINNACDSMPNGGSLVIETVMVDLQHAGVSAPSAGERDTIAPGRYIGLSIEDSGTGMSEETLARIFEPFFTTKTLGKGTGLGLATVFGIVRQSGGHIRVTSELGKGTRFELLFPEVNGEAPPSSKPPTRGRNANVLLVESNPAVRASVVQMLEASHHKVTLAASARQALDIVHRSEHRFDLLISDLALPESSGSQLAVAVWRVDPRLHVLLLANGSEARAPADSLAPALTRRIHRLTKPFTKRDLDEKLRLIHSSGNMA